MIISQGLPVLVIMGPTATGKTELSYKLADALPFDVEIISVDSAMIYRGMNIGTAKPSLQLQKRYRHHLIDIRNPNEVYSVADFIQSANEVITAIHQRQAIPLMVGGTMMYHYFFQHGLSTLPKANADLRASYEKDAALHGWKYLHKRLQAVDPRTAQQVHSNDGIRISRALEVYELTGSPLSLINQNQQSNNLMRYQFKTLAITVSDRAVLHNRIANRFELMLQNGFKSEVEQLISEGYMLSDSSASRCVGYRQMMHYLKGEIDKKEMKERAIIATRQLAKRQMTWIKRYFSSDPVVQMDFESIDMAKLASLFS